MKTLQFDVDRGYPDRFKNIGWRRKPEIPLTVHCEIYDSVQEFIRVGRSRTLKCKSYRFTDYFDPNFRYYAPRDFCGFDTASELWSKVTRGLTDLDYLRRTKAYANSANVTEEEKLSRITYGESGGMVNIGRYLAGIPQCMARRTKTKVKSRTLQIGLEVCVLCDILPRDYEATGRAIAKTIMKLEKAGYSTSFNVLASITNHNRHIAGVLNIPIKKTGQPMNLAKMLFPVADISFYRGAIFAWMSRFPLVPYISGFGTYMTYEFYHTEATAIRDSVIERCMGNCTDLTIFSYSDLLDLYIYKFNRDGDRLEAYLESMILG